MNSALYRMIARRFLPQLVSVARVHTRLLHNAASSKNFADIFGRGLISESKWTNIRDSLINLNTCDTKNVDNFVIDFCKNNNFALENCISYIEFLYANGIPVKLNVKMKVIGLFRQYVYNETPNEILSDQIAGLCQSIINENDHIDIRKALQLFQTLAVTREWRRALPAIDKYNIRCCAENLEEFSIIAANAFWENEPQIGWDVLGKIIETDFAPQCIAFMAYLNYCVMNRNVEFVENLEKMLEFIGDHDITVSEAVVTELHSAINGNSVEIGSISNNGKCSCCHQRLDSIKLSTLEFNTLKKDVEKYIVNKEKILEKSNTSELMRFKQVVNKKRKFDYVIDGLNTSLIFHTTGNIMEQSIILKGIVEKLVNKRKRVLVIGRKHMEKWPELYLNYVKTKSTMFLTNDTSDDDLYLLSALFTSGEYTDFISSDRMRIYAQLLPPDSRSIFHQWHKQHRNTISKDGNNDLQINYPKYFKNFCHKNLNGQWHIPFVRSPLHKPNREIDENVQWICLKL